MHKKNFQLASLPVFIWMLVFVGLPLIYIVGLSFLSRTAIGGIGPPFTIKNYARVFEPLYIKIFINSLGMALTTSVLTLFIGYPFGYFIARLDPRYRLKVFFMVMIPFWTSSLLRVYGFIILLRYDGVINTVGMALNIIKQPLQLIYNYESVLAGTVYMLLPLMTLPVYNTVEKMDNSLLEASRDLGAGKLKTFIYITLPMTLPGIVGGVSLVFIPAVGLFFISDLLGGAKTMLLGNLIRDQVQSARDWPFGAALAVILLVVVCFFVYLYSKADKEGGKLI